MYASAYDQSNSPDYSLAPAADWRSRSAQTLRLLEHSGGDERPAERDHYVRLQLAYLEAEDDSLLAGLHHQAALSECHDPELDRVSVIWANRLYAASDYQALKWRIEALITCLGLGARDVSLVTGIPAPVIACYERLFYSLWSLDDDVAFIPLCHRQGILRDKALTAREYYGCEDNPRYMKYIAMKYGITGLLTLWDINGMSLGINSQGFVINVYQNILNMGMRRLEEAYTMGLTRPEEVQRMTASMGAAIEVLKNPNSMRGGTDDAQDDLVTEALNLLTLFAAPEVKDRIASDPEIVADNIGAKLGMMRAMSDKAKKSTSLKEVAKKLEGV